MATPPSSELPEANVQPYQQEPPLQTTSPIPAITTASEQLPLQVKPPLAKTTSSTYTIPQSTTPPTTTSSSSSAQGGGERGGGGGGGAGGFLATVRNAATDMLGISSTASPPPIAGAETVPNGVNNNSNNDSNGDINGGETVSGDDDARRQGNTTGDATNTTTTTTKAENQGTDFLQPEAMTMEASQMNGDSIQYEPYEADNNPTVMTTQGGGPGSFPESIGVDGQEYSYNGSSNGGYSPAASTSSQNDGEEYSPSNININFVYANEKRFSDFHSVFRSVPDEEKLIEDYGCALQKEILVQGRLYISDDHVCFNANIFGWVTNLVIAFSEITAIEKRLTAFVIPNAISIVTTTNTKGHFFASFLSRDAAHDLLMAAWRKSFPCAANASVTHNNAYFRLNRSNVTVNDEDDTDSFISARPASDSRRNRHRRSSSASQNWTADEADWDETGEDMDGRSSTGSRRRGSKRTAVKKIFKGTSTETARTGRGRSQSELPPRPTSFDFKQANPSSKSTFDLEGQPRNTRSASESAPTSLAIKTNGHAAANGSAPAAAAGTSTGAGANHAPTTCNCSKDGRHYANSFMSETYPGTIESMWKLLFDSNFSKSFLTNEAMKGADVQEEAWNGTSEGTSTKVTKYTKWLGMPIGPKTTKAILTDVCENKNFDEYVTTVTTTSTPDVPSGGSFTTKCRTCITWAGPNQVLVVVTGAVEFTKSSWIKGQIEKGAAEGMGTHYKELNASIRKHIAAHPEEFGEASAGSVSAPITSDAGRRAPTSSSKTTASTQERARAKQNHQHPPTAQPSREKSKSEKSPAVATQQAVGKSGTSGGAAGLLSGIMASFSTGPDGEGASYMALMTVLVIVMLANVYIWFQISSVTSQIEKIQGDVFADQRGGGRSHMSSSPKGGYYGGVDYDSGFGDAGYTRDQEEAMWAWLTEREERHRRYQRAAAGREWSRMRKQERNDNDNDSNLNDHTSSTSSSSSSASALTEAKLQARINELQQQLEALEKALERGGASQEL